MAEDIRITGENAQCVYYCSRMISAQYGTEFVKSNYQNVRKVYKYLDLSGCAEGMGEHDNPLSHC